MWGTLYKILIKGGDNSSTWSSLEGIILPILSKWTSRVTEEIRTLWDLAMQPEGCRLPSVLPLPQVWSWVTTGMSNLPGWRSSEPSKAPRTASIEALWRMAAPESSMWVFSRQLAGDVVTSARWCAGLCPIIVVCGKYPLTPSGWQLAPKWFRKMSFVPYCEFPLSSGLFLKQTLKRPPKPQKTQIRKVHKNGSQLLCFGNFAVTLLQRKVMIIFPDNR